MGIAPSSPVVMHVLYLLMGTILMYVSTRGMGDAALATAVLDPCAPDGAAMAPEQIITALVRSQQASKGPLISVSDPRVMAALAQIPASCQTRAVDDINSFVLSGFMTGAVSPPILGGPLGGAVINSSASQSFLDSAFAWVKANPLMTAGAAVGIFLLVKR